MPLPNALAELRSTHRDHITAWRHLPARPAVVGPMPARLAAPVVNGLCQRGITDLYSHQAQAIEAALDGKHVCVVTPTASGKTLCYMVPTLQALLADPASRALYLFPTKALAQDQLTELGRWQDTLKAPIAPATYDGDTPQSARSRIRRTARVVVTNPDMLHTGILPHHTQWADFFEGLRLVVLDEMHTYRGVFGSHVANVLRRLRRIAAFYGAHPQFILCSATIANPGELAEALIEAPVTVVDTDGAPRGERTLICLNPPIVDHHLGIRRSASSEATSLARLFLGHDVQTAVFAGSRLTTEVILHQLRQHSSHTVSGYRGGYLPTERRVIEAGLRDGAVRGVVTTNALELGVDIGGLDAVILAGYPGSIASTWQQSGRAGRRGSPPAAVLIASGGPLDQYIMAHPDYLWDTATGRPATPERALINPDNPLILMDHLRCAIFELPFASDEAFGGQMSEVSSQRSEVSSQRSDGSSQRSDGSSQRSDGSSQMGLSTQHSALSTQHSALSAQHSALSTQHSALSTQDLLSFLAEEGEIHRAGTTWHWLADAYPAQRVGLRTASPDRVVILAGDPSVSSSPPSLAGQGPSVSSSPPSAAGQGPSVSSSPPSPAGQGPSVSSSPPSAAGQGPSVSFSPPSLPGKGPSVSSSPPSLAGKGAGGLGPVRTIGEVDRGSAPALVYPGAIYLHDGAMYHVDSLEWDAGQAFTHPVTVDYYTDATGSSDVQVVTTHAETPVRGCLIAHGEVEITSQVTGYRQIKFGSHETLGWGEVDLPAQTLLTTAYWLRLAETTISRFRDEGWWRFDANDYGPTWAQQRDAARRRDLFRCRNCGAPERDGRQHDVHHLQPFRSFGYVRSQNRHDLIANRLENLVTLCQSCHRRAEEHQRVRGVLSGLAHVVGHLAPLYLMCDPRDLGILSEAKAVGTGLPTLYIHERIPAGLGFAAALFDLHPRLMADASALIHACPCDHGCPGCIGPTTESDPQAKAWTLRLLEELTGSTSP